MTSRTTPSSRDLWLYVAPALAVAHVALVLVLQARLGLAGVLLWHVGPAALTIVAIVAMGAGLWQAARKRLTWTPARATGYVLLAAVIAMPLAYRTYPSSRDNSPSQVRFLLPLPGPVTVVWGGPTRDVNYHVVSPAERWAYDLLVRRDGRSYRTDGRSPADYYAYDLPVLAPADGAVRVVQDGEADSRLAGQSVLGGCGNRIVLEVAEDEFLFLCHLRAGSIAVRPGASVRAGQPIARVGNSGNSTEPHLHVHLQTTPRPEIGEGIPFYFHDYRDASGFVERGMPTGGMRARMVESAK